MLLDPFNKLKLNYNLGDTLKLNIKKKWDIKCFDAVIGNPPYQEISKTTGISKGGTNLYTKFINYSFNILLDLGYLCFITPISWLGPSTNKQMGSNLLHEIFLKYDLLFLNLNECKKYFNVGSSFSYYIINKKITPKIKTNIISYFEKNIIFSNINLKKYFHLKYLPIHITKDTLKLINEITTNTNKLKIERCRTLDTSTKYGKLHLSKIKDEKFTYLTLHTTTINYYSDIKLSIYEADKIILNMSGYLKPELHNNCNLTESKFYIIPKDIKNAKIILDYLTTDKITLYLKLCKYSGFNSRIILENITY